MGCSDRETTTATDFPSFARRKERAARAAAFERFETVVDNSAQLAADAIRNEFTDALLDGPFYQSPLPPHPLPSVNLVFVQSRDGDTDAKDPSALGGGATDKHVIYEGLSRIAADAVLSGAKTIESGRMILSVWHPELVRLRRQLGKARHPVQIVITRSGDLPIEEGLLFNAQEIPVVIMTSAATADTLSRRLRSRPWVTLVVINDRSGLRSGMERLRAQLGIRRISAIGGRSAATALIDAGVVQDLYLTTSPINAGTPDTPLYTGNRPPARHLVVRKQSATGIVFEHFVLGRLTS